MTNPDHFKTAADGSTYAGDHLLLEFWSASGLTDPDFVRNALQAAAHAAGATLVHSHYHQFGANGGVSGIAVLAESHISIHTWPERRYAAIDIFMCGICDPMQCVPTLLDHFRPEHHETRLIKRGTDVMQSNAKSVA